MGKGRGWACAYLLGMGLLAAWAPAWAQSSHITPENEYKDLIRVSQDIQPLGEHPFGARIGLYNGSLSFEQTDVSLAGNGPLLQLTRVFLLRGREYGLGRDSSPAFGDWELDLPRIATMTADQNNVTGWQVGSSGNTNRCSYFTTPPSVVVPTGDNARADWEPATWWHGYQLVIPGQGSQDLLGNQGSDKAIYPIVTKQHWRISCLDHTANGQPGQAFLAQAPDGTRYWFDELVYRWAPALHRSLDSGPTTERDTHRRPLLTGHRRLLAEVLGWLTGAAPVQALPVDDFLKRREGWMLVTKIEDRFGNWLKYSYNADGYLTAIKAGVVGDSTVRRELTVQYVSGTHRIHSVILQPHSDSPRTWTYAYTGTSIYHMQLTSVTLPDGRQWHFDLDAFDTKASLKDQSVGSCRTVGDPIDLDSTWMGTITHPSGLKGRFTIKPVKHGRSYVPFTCLGDPSTENAPGGYAAMPDAWYSFTLTQKQFSGAGIPTETWQYDYSPANPSWSDQCSGGCDSEVWTKVRNPDGSSVKYTFSNRYNYTESQLKKTEFYTGNGTGLLRKVVNIYAQPTGHAWPSRIGYNPQERINADQTEQRSPLAKRVIHQNGDNYTWMAEAFNAYAQVAKTKRFSSIGGPECSSKKNRYCIEEQTIYRNDTTHWVLGLPTQVKNLTTGEVEDAYTYNTATDLLTSRARFGQAAMDYTWNSAGQLASFTDANGNKTTLSSYKRGIPQTIGYPDGTSQHLSVDAFGQITAVTNQAGYTNHYTYDAAGRLTKITYPSDWAPKTFAYTYVTDAERGLGAGHWRRTVSQGNARHVTYYDALLRPALTDTYIAGDSGSHISARKTYNWKSLATFASWPVAGSPALSSITAGTTTTYDALGRVMAVSQPSELGTLTTVTAYLSGARKRVTDPAGHITTTGYQVFDAPSYKAVIKVQAPEDVVQTVTRNLYGDATAITQSGPDGQSGTISVTKHLYYNPQHRLCRIEEPETGNTLMGYDAAGNLIWSAEGQSVNGNGCGTKPTHRTKRTYDAMNRVKEVIYPEGQGSITTTYDDLGQVEQTEASTAKGSVTWVYTHDSLGHVTDETLAVDNHHWSIRYAYDSNGAMSRITYPDGKRITYAPDALGRPTKVGAYATGVSYFPDGALKHFIYMDGKAEYLASRCRKASGCEPARPLLRNLTVLTPAKFIYSQDVFYDKDADIVQMKDLTDSQKRDETLTYDALNRLITAKAPHLWDGTITYGYDALNNLRKLSYAGLVHTYHYDAAQHLTAIKKGGTTLHSFVYDTRGDVTQKDDQSRIFGAAHRLLSVSGIASYVYDAAGRRVKVVDADGQSTYDAYNHAGHLMYQWDAATDSTRDYVYLGKKLIARVDRAEGDAVLNAPGVSIDANPNNGRYTVSWSAIKGAKYTLQEQTNGGSWHAAYSGTATHKAESGKAGGTYRYRVRACQDGCSDWGLSAVVGVTPVKPTVTVPSGYQHGTYTIHWTRPVSTVDVDVQEQFNGGSWKTLASGSKATSLARPGATDGSYVYRVRANNASGTRGWSSSHKVTVLHAPSQRPSLSVPGTSRTGGYTVKWGSVAGASSYTLQQRVNKGSWSTQYTGSGRSKAYSGKTNGAHYGYRVKACNAVGCSDWTSAKSVAIAIPPPKPKNVYANERQPKPNLAFLTIVWHSVSGASKYQVRDVHTGVIVRTTEGTSYDADSGDPPLTEDVFAVRSCNAWACSAWVNASRRWVPLQPTEAPSLKAPSGSQSGSYTVSWGLVWQAVSYTLQERKNSGSWHTVYSGSDRSKHFSGKANARYGYRVRASNSGGDGPWSATKTTEVTRPPATPSGFTVSVGNSDWKPVVYASWNMAARANRYELQMRYGSSGAWRATVDNDDTDTQWSQLISYSGEVYFRVRACNGVGCSGWSGTRHVTLQGGLGIGFPSLSTSVSMPEGERQ